MMLTFSLKTSNDIACVVCKSTIKFFPTLKFHIQCLFHFFCIQTISKEKRRERQSFCHLIFLNTVSILHIGLCFWYKKSFEIYIIHEWTFLKSMTGPGKWCSSPDFDCVLRVLLPQATYYAAVLRCKVHSLIPRVL